MKLKINDKLISYLIDLLPDKKERRSVLEILLLHQLVEDNKENSLFIEAFWGGSKEDFFQITLEEETLQKLIEDEFFGDLDEIIKQNVKAKSKIPLFPNEEKSKRPGEEEPESLDSWIQEFRALFKIANPDRVGTLSTCKERMKWFLKTFPNTNKDIILGATSMYLRHVSRKDYVMKAHKFIYDGSGQSKNSTLEEWVERYLEYTSKNISSNTPIQNQDKTEILK